MFTRDIICTNCGLKGEIEIHGLPGVLPPEKRFKHLGHNPFSGHMHFQCPACSIILLADPMEVLGKEVINTRIARRKRETEGFFRFFTRQPLTN